MQRIPEFDALRGLAAVTIVVYHLWFPWSAPMATAVNLFFVISGYLITSIILRNLDENRFLRVFYARRALRIWPIYYLALIAVVAINLVSPLRQPMDGLPYYMVHLQRIQCYLMMPVPPFINTFFHTWTLAIEEQFYLFWPLLICLAGRRAVCPLASLLIGIPIVARAAGFDPWLLLTQCDGLALGGLLAGLLANRSQTESSRCGFHAVLVSLCIFSAFFTLGGASALSQLGEGWKPLAASLKVSFTNVFYFGFVGLIVGLSGHPALWILRSRQLGYLGKISYGLYLYHCIIVLTAHQLFRYYGLTRWWWVDALTFGSTVAVAALSWRFVEQPILALKDRWNYRSEASPSARAQAAPDSPIQAGIVAGPHDEIVVCPTT